MPYLFTSTSTSFEVIAFTVSIMSKCFFIQNHLDDYMRVRLKSSVSKIMHRSQLHVFKNNSESKNRKILSNYIEFKYILFVVEMIHSSGPAAFKMILMMLIEIELKLCWLVCLTLHFPLAIFNNDSPIQFNSNVFAIENCGTQIFECALKLNFL